MPKLVLNSLTDKPDKELIALIKNKGDNEAFLEICRRYENVFYKMCQRYVIPLAACGVDVKDIFDDKNFIIFNCVQNYNPRKGTKLSTHIGNYARYLCLNSINERRFILPSFNDEDIKKHLEEGQPPAERVGPQHATDEDFKYVLNIIQQVKDPRVSDVFKLRYFSGKKMIWAKIAKRMKISTQTAINLHSKGIELLRRKIKSKNISDVI